MTTSPAAEAASSSRLPNSRVEDGSPSPAVISVIVRVAARPLSGVVVFSTCVVIFAAAASVTGQLVG